MGSFLDSPNCLYVVVVQGKRRRCEPLLSQIESCAYYVTFKRWESKLWVNALRSAALMSHWFAVPFDATSLLKNVHFRIPCCTYQLFACAQVKCAHNWNGILQLAHLISEEGGVRKVACSNTRFW